MGDYSASEVEKLLGQIANPELRNQTAAALSKVAAKAEGVLCCIASLRVHFFLSPAFDTCDLAWCSAGRIFPRRSRGARADERFTVPVCR